MKDERVNKYKLLQSRILMKAMTPKEYEDLIKRYEENKTRTGSREDFLNKKITSRELSILKDYFNIKLTRREIVQKYGMRMSGVSYKAAMIAIRFLYKNLDKIKLDGGDANDK